jgi:DNA-binding IclR family transcriptional regulator
LPRKKDIEAAIAAHNATDGPRQTLLPPEAVRLLTVMFPKIGVCQPRLDDLAAKGFDRRTLPRLLRALIDAGFLSKKEVRRGATGLYCLRLPPPAAAGTPISVRRPPTDRPRRQAIEAAVEAFTSPDRSAIAVRLLTTMFDKDGVCRRSAVALSAACGLPKNTIDRWLVALVAVGLLSEETAGRGVTRTCRLHLPPRRQG